MICSIFRPFLSDYFSDYIQTIFERIWDPVQPSYGFVSKNIPSQNSKPFRSLHVFKVTLVEILWLQPSLRILRLQVCVEDGKTPWIQIEEHVWVIPCKSKLWNLEQPLHKNRLSLLTCGWSDSLPGICNHRQCLWQCSTGLALSKWMAGSEEDKKFHIGSEYRFSQPIILWYIEDLKGKNIYEEPIHTDLPLELTSFRDLENSNLELVPITILINTHRWTYPPWICAILFWTCLNCQTLHLVAVNSTS